MQVQPYLMMNGRCEEALQFYREALNAEVTALIRFKDHAESMGGLAPGTEEKILHSSFRVGDATVMASDGDCKGSAQFQGISLALTVKNDQEADEFFNKLSSGGTVQMPLTPTFFSSKFGMLVDRFGVSWLVSVAQ